MADPKNPMPIRTRSMEAAQLSFFREPPSRPSWSELPDGTRVEVRRLLALLLRAFAERAGVELRKEVRNDHD